ncbi:MAG: sn-glycerol-1-phosphate dehydrogenase [Lawsonibacter sp.]|jgi:glycerol-1-phosphate dehydrogenase [NAD(P)+]
MQLLTRDLTLSECLNETFSCTCGRTHTAALEGASIGENALLDLPKWLKAKGYSHVYLICDAVTVKIAGEKVNQLLTHAGIDVCMHVITHAAFDEATLGELLIGKDSKRDVVVAVGTGSINDMCRYLSFQVDLPYCIVATAAPMDGFASSISALTVNNLKTTFEVRSPQYIVGDTEILKGAPYSMISAGLGDLIGKFTCLCDWKLSRIINGEYYCQTIVEMVEGCAHRVLEQSHRVKERDPQVLGSIMEGLVFTGVAMSMVGNSRPASGCEHHISHYWEMLFEQQGRRPVPHGLQVGVGTILILKLVEAFCSEGRPDFARARQHADNYNPEEWEKEIRRAYGPAAPGILAMEADAKKNDARGCRKRIDAMEAHWEEIAALLKQLPKSQTVIQLMQELQAPYLPGQIGVDRELLRDTLCYCKEVRARYTILQLLWDLGRLEDLADRVVEQCQASLEEETMDA